MRRENTQRTSRLVSREKRLERYSRRTERRSMSPGGGIKLKFGEMRRSKMNFNFPQKDGGVRKANKSFDVGKEDRGKAVQQNMTMIDMKLGENKKKQNTNIFGDFIGDQKQENEEEQGKGRKISRLTTLNKQNIIKRGGSRQAEVQDSEVMDERHSFDTKSDEKGMGSSEYVDNQGGKIDDSLKENETETMKGMSRPGVQVGGGVERMSRKADLKDKLKIEELEKKIVKLENTVQQQKEMVEFYKEKANEDGQEGVKEENEKLIREQKEIMIKYNDLSGEFQKIKDEMEEKKEKIEKLNKDKKDYEKEKEVLIQNMDKGKQEDYTEKENLLKQIKKLEQTIENKNAEIITQSESHELALEKEKEKVLTLEAKNSVIEKELNAQGNKDEEDVRTMAELHLEIETLKKKLEHMTEQYNEEKAKNKTIVEGSKSNKTEQEKEKLLRLKAEEQLLESQEKFEKLEKEKKEFEEEVEKERKQVNDTMVKLKDQIQNLNEKLENWKKESISQQENNINKSLLNEELEVLKYENEKLKKNNKIMEMKVKDFKSTKNAAEKKLQLKDREIKDIQNKLNEIEKFKEQSNSEMGKVQKDFDNMRKAKESIEKDLSRSMMKIGNTLQILNNVKLKSKDRNLIMNALVGI